MLLTTTLLVRFIACDIFNFFFSAIFLEVLGKITLPFFITPDPFSWGQPRGIWQRPGLPAEV